MDGYCWHPRCHYRSRWCTHGRLVAISSHLWCLCGCHTAINQHEWREQIRMRSFAKLQRPFSLTASLHLAPIHRVTNWATIAIVESNTVSCFSSPRPMTFWTSITPSASIGCDPAWSGYKNLQSHRCVESTKFKIHQCYVVQSPNP